MTLHPRWDLISSKEGKIDLRNGRNAIIKVTLIDSKGRRYKAAGYGMAGEAYAAYFGIPKIKFVKVEVTSSINIDCSEVSWYCFDPI
jgi:hypothetical protein